MRIALAIGLAGLCLLLPYGVANSAESGAGNDGSPLNAGTVTIMSGTTFDGTAVVARDIAAMINRADSSSGDVSLRAVPMIGQGPAQTLRDVLSLGSVDMGVTHSTVLNHYAQSGELGPIKERLVYVAKLFNEDLHLLAGADIATVEDLNGKTVNVGPEGSATEIAAQILFDALGLEVEAAHLDEADAVAKLKSGEIDATILIGTTPIAGLAQIGADASLKLLPVPYPQGLEDDTYPAVLTHGDYPALIESGARVDTVGICAVLVALGDKADADRQAQLALFVDRFFSRFDTLLQPPNHAKWRDVNFAATLEGWQRAPQAQAWIDAARSTAVADAQERESFKAFLTQTGDVVAPDSVSDADQEKLFRAFKAWSKAQQSN
ncbi:TAXI family TRAP transporter solute-binding subunit [Methyloceanibacter sp. wino2]|uniref:TAXI family TRAP transporter solute-binding subunit n=1 Tax=Methyloceanibacter sp. wino2 TaxID=2170729 RepID=UPI000D3E34BC|nr:TAXI family TRAP transporter solute-binding subunit [Methyloceanibacter sp. wino2]